MTTTTASKKNYPFCKEKQALFLPNPNDDDAMQRAQHNEDKTLNTHVYSPLQCQDQAALHFLPTIILYSLNRLYHNTIAYLLLNFPSSFSIVVGKPAHTHSLLVTSSSHYVMSSVYLYVLPSPL